MRATLSRHRIVRRHQSGPAWYWSYRITTEEPVPELGHVCRTTGTKHQMLMLAKRHGYTLTEKAS